MAAQDDTPDTDQDVPVSPLDADQLGSFLPPSESTAELSDLARGRAGAFAQSPPAIAARQRLSQNQSEVPAFDFATVQGLQLLHEATSYLRHNPQDLGLGHFLISTNQTGQTIDGLPINVSRTAIINELLIWARKEVLDAEGDEIKTAQTRITNLTSIIPLLPAIETELTLAATNVRRLETQALSLRLPIATVLANERRAARSRGTHSLDYIYGKFNDYLNARSTSQFRSQARMLAEHRREEAKRLLAESIEEQVKTWGAKTDAPSVEQLNRLTGGPTGSIYLIAEKAVDEVADTATQEAATTLKATLKEEIAKTMSPNAVTPPEVNQQIDTIVSPVAEEHIEAIISAHELHAYVENASFRYAAQARAVADESQATLRTQLRATLTNQLTPDQLIEFEQTGGLDRLVYITHGLALIDRNSVEGAALTQAVTSFLESDDGKTFLPPAIAEATEAALAGTTQISTVSPPEREPIPPQQTPLSGAGATGQVVPAAPPLAPPSMQPSSPTGPTEQGRGVAGTASQLVGTVVSFATQTPIHIKARDFALGVAQLDRLPEAANDDTVKETTAHMNEMHTEAMQTGATTTVDIVGKVIKGLAKGVPGQLNPEVNEFSDQPSSVTNIFSKMVRRTSPKALGFSDSETKELTSFTQRIDRDPELQFAVSYYLNVDRILLALSLFGAAGNRQAVTYLTALDQKGRNHPLYQELLHDALRRHEMALLLRHFDANQLRAEKIARIFFTHPMMKFLVNHSLTELPAVFVRAVKKKIALKTGEAGIYLVEKGYNLTFGFAGRQINRGFTKWYHGFSPFRILNQEERQTLKNRIAERNALKRYQSVTKQYDLLKRERAGLPPPGWRAITFQIKQPFLKLNRWAVGSKARRIVTAPVRKPLNLINKAFTKLVRSARFKKFMGLLKKFGGILAKISMLMTLAKYSGKFIKKLATIVGLYLYSLYLWLVQIGIAALVGASIGAVLGLISGGIIGAQIGLVIASFTAPLLGPFGYLIFVPTGAIIGALAGTAIGAAICAIIGATLQYMGATHLAGAIGGATLGATIGFWVGIPFLPFGGPIVGAIVGAAAGAVIGSVVQFVAEKFFSSDAGTATQIGIHNAASNFGDAAKSSITKPVATPEAGLESPAGTTTTSLGRGGAGVFGGSSAPSAGISATVVGTTIAIGIAVGLIAVTNPPPDTTTGTTHGLVLTGPDKINNNERIAYKLAATIISCDTTVTIDNPLPANTDLTAIQNPLIKTGGTITAIEASATNQKLQWKVTIKQPNCQAKSPPNSTLTTTSVITPYSLTPDFCQGANPTGCSQTLKSLFESAASWATMPAAVLAGIGNQEWKATFRHTDDDIRQWSKPGVVIEPNGPSDHPRFQNGCAVSFAFAEGPFQFLTGKGGYANIWQSYQGASTDAGLRSTGYEGQACNILDGAYGAAKKLKSNSGMQLGDRKEVWSQDDVYQVARAYLGACVPNYNQTINYCEGVWQYYKAFTPRQL